MQFVVFVALLVLALVVAIGLFYLLRSSLNGLLRHTVAEPSGITFYERSFLLVLVLLSFSAALGISFDLKPDAHFMEYVWKWAGGLASVLQSAGGVLLAYLVMITVLVAALKIKNDQ